MLNPLNKSESGEAATSEEPASPKTKFAGKRKAVKIVDKQTGVVYDSKSKAGKALAEEFGLDPGNSFVWYQVVKAAPDRFDVGSKERSDPNRGAPQASFRLRLSHVQTTNSPATS